MKTLSRGFSNAPATTLLAVCALLLQQSAATAATAHLVKDIDAIPSPRGGDPSSLIDLGNGIALFFACQETTGCEPWRTDGTATGTMLLKDIYPGIRSSHLLFDSTTLIGGVLYF